MHWQRAKQLFKKYSVMIFVMWRTNKMVQSVVLAFVAEIIILSLLGFVFLGVQKLSHAEMIAPVIIQLQGAQEKKTPVTGLPKETKTLIPLSKLKSRSLVRPSRPQPVKHEPLPYKQTGEIASSESIKTPAVSAEATGAQGFFSEQPGTQGEGVGKENPLMAYAAKVKAAVQAAVEYPASANNMRTKCRARVEFALRDGVQQNPHIVKSSGLSVFDRAAIHTVEIAFYPAPPGALVGKTSLFQVWVEFNQ